MIFPTAKFKRGQRGVSLLLEMVLGLGIFAVGLLVTLGIIAVSTRSTVGARNHAAALNLAKASLDAEKSKPFDTVAGSTRFVVVENERAGLASPTDFDVEVEVVDEAVDRKRILSRVSWREDNRVRKIELYAYAVDL